MFWKGFVTGFIGGMVVLILTTLLFSNAKDEDDSVPRETETD